MKNFSEHLLRFGPESEHERLNLQQSLEYCINLMRKHYENFTVASWLLPARLKPHFAAIYAYCRWADDLADEVQDENESKALLSWWQHELERCFSGEAKHPVFIALIHTIEKFEIPQDPFQRLLIAFRQDQHLNQYSTFEQLLEYCNHSANPVGELVLYLGRCHAAENLKYSDSICTGLQLINFWQDVKRDYELGRIYLPDEDRIDFCVELTDFESERTSDALKNLIKEKVHQAERFLKSGIPLVAQVPRELQLEISLFIKGGLAIAEEIKKNDYDVLRTRPQVSKWRKIQLLFSAYFFPNSIV